MNYNSYMMNMNNKFRRYQMNVRNAQRSNMYNRQPVRTRQNVNHLNNRLQSLQSNIQQRQLTVQQQRATTKNTTQIDNSEYLEPDADEEINKYFSYINLKNFYFNYKTNEDIIYNRYLRPKIYIERNERETVLVMNEWGYPPFGGGENWILDTCRVMNRKYNCYMLCFRDQFKNMPYTGYQIKNLDYCKVILMEKDLTEICKLIYAIKPKLICHQGVERIFAMKVANCTNIPFVTGFCFWNDMIEFKDQSNLEMMKHEQEITKQYPVIQNSSYCYVVSKFMNDILKKNKLSKLPVIDSISYKETFDAPF